MERMQDGPEFVVLRRRQDVAPGRNEHFVAPTCGEDFVAPSRSKNFVAPCRVAHGVGVSIPTHEALLSPQHFAFSLNMRPEGIMLKKSYRWIVAGAERHNKRQMGSLPSGYRQDWPTDHTSPGR
jgi:hypothetical protein